MTVEIKASDLMHAVRWPRAFTEDGWIFENKLDGFRALARKSVNSVELISRNGRAMGAQFSEIIAALRGLPDCVLDAELVALDSTGNPVWDHVRTRAVTKLASSIARAVTEKPATLCASDLPATGPEDLRSLPLVERKARLLTLLPRHPCLHYINDIASHGEALFATAVALGQEGIVAKRADSPYKAGRQPTWRKIKNAGFYRQEALGFRQ